MSYANSAGQTLVVDLLKQASLAQMLDFPVDRLATSLDQMTNESKFALTRKTKETLLSNLDKLQASSEELTPKQLMDQFRSMVHRIDLA